ncbi:AKT1 [Symbiodinium sp. KB8]|nr:AKT1 [Symbiodinium sp. KB8]
MQQDPNKKSVKKSVTFLPHIEVCEYSSMESQSSSELRALWKWPDENDPEEDTEDIFHELGVGPGAGANQAAWLQCLSRFVTPPMSRRRMVWDTLALIILAIEVIAFPLSAFEAIEVLMTSEPTFIVMDWISACFWLTDMPLQLFAGYNTIEGKIEKRFSYTALRYLKSWFCLDLLIVSLDWASLVGHYDAEFLEALRVGKTVRGIRIVRGVRILRLAKVAPMLQNVADSLYGDLNVLIFKISNIVLSVVCVNHFIACFWYWLGSFTGEGGQPSWTTDVQAGAESAGFQYVAAFHWSLSNFATATTRINAINMWEHIYAIFVLFAGLVSFASSVSAITSAVTDYRSVEVDTLQNEKKLRSFFGDRAISPAMSSRIWEFVRSRRRTRPKLTESNVILLTGLPKILRIELRKDMFIPHLQAHPLFQGLELADPHVISRLCDRGLEFRGVPPMEDVFNRAEKAAHVYYCISGQLQYYFQRPQARRSVSGAIDVHAGEWIAEGALWFEPRMHFFILHLQGMSDSNILVTSRDQDKGGAHVYCVNTDELMNLDLRKRREC